MRYMLLLYSDEAQFGRMGQKEMGETMAAYQAYTESLRKSGVYVASDRLRPVSTATTVRAKDSDFAVMDGPYAETKEELGGFYMIDVADLDAALKWARQCPTARHGIVEVRPIWEM